MRDPLNMIHESAPPTKDRGSTFVISVIYSACISKICHLKLSNSALDNATLKQVIKIPGNANASLR